VYLLDQDNSQLLPGLLLVLDAHSQVGTEPSSPVDAVPQHPIRNLNIIAGGGAIKKNQHICFLETWQVSQVFLVRCTCGAKL
jgi:hypothetical protein